MNRNEHRLSHLKAAVGFKPTDTESVVELVDHYLHEKDMVSAEEALLTAAAVKSASSALTMSFSCR